VKSRPREIIGSRYIGRESRQKQSWEGNGVSDFISSIVTVLLQLYCGKWLEKIRALIVISKHQFRFVPLVKLMAKPTNALNAKLRRKMEM
jgi:hypothetical protein